MKFVAYPITRPDANGLVQVNWIAEAQRAQPLSNRRMGPEIVMQMAEDRAPHGFETIDEVIPRQELEAVADGYKKVAGFSRDALNAGLSVLDGA